MFVDRRTDGGHNGKTLVNVWSDLLLGFFLCLRPVPDLAKVRSRNKRFWNLPQVICCEGNAGFYEVGCMNTPLDGKGSAHCSMKRFSCRSWKCSSVFVVVPCSWILRPGLEPPWIWGQHGEQSCHMGGYTLVFLYAMLLIGLLFFMVKMITSTVALH